MVVIDTATVSAFHTEPVLEGRVGTVAVVGLQNLVNDDEEVENPTGGQRVQNRLPTITLAERFRLNVRVCSRVTGGRGMRIRGDHSV